MDTTDRKLKTSTGRTGLWGTLRTDTLSSLSTFSSLSAFTFTLTGENTEIQSEVEWTNMNLNWESGRKAQIKRKQTTKADGRTHNKG